MTDPMWMKVMLGVHIAAGFSAFVLAPIALVTAKGGKAHRLWGKVYFWAMTTVSTTALPMALYRPVLFLALVSIFSWYNAFTAYRVLYLKDLVRGGSAKAVDWVVGGLTFACCASLAYLGAFHPARVQGMGAVSIAFGGLGMYLVIRTVKNFIWKPTEKMFWWYGHMGGMVGSYIAAWTAFSAVTLSRYFGATWYVWLWPTIIGVPCLIAATGYYRRKFAPRVKVA